MSFTDVVIIDRDTGFEKAKLHYDSLQQQLIIESQEGIQLLSRAGHDIQLNPSQAVNFTNYTFPVDDGQFRQVLTTDGAGQLSFVSIAATLQITLDDLVDVVVTSPANGDILVYNSTSGHWENTQLQITTSFIELTDTPADYTGHANKIVTVNATEDGLEFNPGDLLAPVDSVFGRTDAVVAATGDYNSDQVTNNSTVTGISVSDALESIELDAASAVQPGDNISVLVNDAGYITLAQVPADAVTSVAGKTGIVTLDKADITDFSDGDYATSVQGILADSATQPGDNVSTLINDAGYLTAGVQVGDNVSVLINDAGYLVIADINSKTDKLPSAVGNLAEFDVDGNLADAGIDVAEVVTETELLAGITTEHLSIEPGLGSNGLQALRIHGPADETFASMIMYTAAFAEFLSISAHSTTASKINSSNDLQFSNGSGQVITMKDLQGINLHPGAGETTSLWGSAWIGEAGEDIWIAQVKWPTALGTANQALSSDGNLNYVWRTFASEAQGALADSAAQTGDNVSIFVNDAGYLTTETPDLVTSVAGRIGDVVIVKADIADFGTYATPAQGTLADSAAQTGDNVSIFVNDAGYITSVTAAPVDSVAGRIGDVVIVKADIADFGTYATPSQGALADSAAQSGDNVSIFVNDAGYVTSVDISGKADKFPPSVAGNFATLDASGNLGDSNSTPSDFATAAQGTTADSAAQSGDNVSIFTNDAGYLTSVTAAPVDSVFGRLGAVIAVSTDYSAFYATTAQGTLADSAIQSGENVSVFVNDAGYLVVSDLTGKADKVIPTVAGNFAALDATGNLIDSTSKTADFATAAQGIVADTAAQSGDNVSIFTNDAGYLTSVSAAPIDTVFGRIGTVVALSSDYASFYASTAQGTLADSALQSGDNVSTLVNDAGYLTSETPAPIDTVHGRTGDVVSAEGDYDLDQLGDVDTTGLVTNQILEFNGTDWTPINTPSGAVTTVHTRSGDVVSATGDYAASQITNDSSITGATVDLALEQIDAEKVDLVIGTIGNIAIIAANGQLGDLGTDAGVFASATQGLLADSAIQPLDNMSELTNDLGFLTDITSESIDSLSDVDLTGNNIGYVLKWDGAKFIVAAETDTNIDSILELTDTPNAYAAQAAKTLVVNNLEDAMVFEDRMADLNDDIRWPAGDGVVGQVLTAQGATYGWTDPGAGGSGTFTGLSDTPTDYVAANNKVVMVDALATGLEYREVLPVPVESVFGRQGIIIAANGDYTTTQITNLSTVSGANATEALNWLTQNKLDFNSTIDGGVY